VSVLSNILLRKKLWLYDNAGSRLAQDQKRIEFNRLQESGYYDFVIDRRLPLIQTECLKRRVDVFEMNLERAEAVDFFW